MPDYKSMYYKLFNVITDVMLELEKAQQATEEIYIVSEDDIKINPKE